MPGAQSRWNRGKDLTWEPLRVERVAEVAYDHLQGDRFRHATRMVRWRPDRRPEDCRYDQLETTPPYELADIFGENRGDDRLVDGSGSRAARVRRLVVIGRAGRLFAVSATAGWAVADPRAFAAAIDGVAHLAPMGVAPAAAALGLGGSSGATALPVDGRGGFPDPGASRRPQPRPRPRARGPCRPGRPSRCRPFPASTAATPRSGPRPGAEVARPAGRRGDRHLRRRIDLERGPRAGRRGAGRRVEPGDALRRRQCHQDVHVGADPALRRPGAASASTIRWHAGCRTGRTRSKITIRMLLNHTSGIRDYFRNPKPRPRPEQGQDAVLDVRRDPGAVCPAGSGLPARHELVVLEHQLPPPRPSSPPRWAARPGRSWCGVSSSSRWGSTTRTSRRSSCPRSPPPSPTGSSTASTGPTPQARTDGTSEVASRSVGQPRPARPVRSPRRPATSPAGRAPSTAVPACQRRDAPRDAHVREGLPRTARSRRTGSGSAGSGSTATGVRSQRGPGGTRAAIRYFPREKVTVAVLFNRETFVGDDVVRILARNILPKPSPSPSPSPASSSSPTAAP